VAEQPAQPEPPQPTLATFSPLVGETFAVEIPETGTFELKLLEARAVPAVNADRDPFVLTFQGPPDPILAQHTFRFTHPALEPTEIFIVAVANDGDGTAYEAIFS
jgi:hypothetical protein